MADQRELATCGRGNCDGAVAVCRGGNAGGPSAARADAARPSTGFPATGFPDTSFAGAGYSNAFRSRAGHSGANDQFAVCRRPIRTCACVDDAQAYPPFLSEDSRGAKRGACRGAARDTYRPRERPIAADVFPGELAPAAHCSPAQLRRLRSAGTCCEYFRFGPQSVYPLVLKKRRRLFPYAVQV
jgi:hypothetical protein